MKLIVFISLIVVALSNPLIETTTLTMNQIYAKVFDVIDKTTKIGDTKVLQLFSDADRACIKERLNLATSGNTITTTFVGTILISTASVLCSIDSYTNLMISYFDGMVKKFSTEDDKLAQLFCIKKKVQEINDGVDQVADEKCQDNLQMLKLLAITKCVDISKTREMAEILETAITSMIEPKDETAFENARKNFVNNMSFSNIQIVNCFLSEITKT